MRQVWPSLPERFAAGDGREMRLVTAQDAAAIEAALPEGQRAETFHFFTVRPFPLAQFIADPAKRAYALWSGDQVLACTTVYNTDEDAGSVMLGYTWVMPDARGRGGAANRDLKSAMYRVLRDAGVREVWFRADVENLRSCHSMEKNGAERMHEEDAPRVYPDRTSRSVFYRWSMSS